MIQEDLLIRIADAMHKMKIPYMMTGGIATIFYGRPRLTHHFDLVLEMGPEHVPILRDTFGDEFYLDEKAIREALNNHSMFNLIHFDSGIKVDFWLLQDDVFDRKRFERRQVHRISGREIVFSSPEDMILKKLLWFKESEIEKHLDDTLGILEIQQNLDLHYLETWAEKLKIQILFKELLDEMSKRKGKIDRN